MNHEYASRPAVSLCMIVRNEEAFLADCLRSVRDVVDEIIVVDTGSTDGTPLIAADFGARVLPFGWNDDFSDARNYSLEHARGAWILVLDADELIAPRDAPRLRTLISGGADGYLFTYRSYSQESHDIRWVANDHSYAEGSGWDGWISGRVVRLFRRDKRIRFSGAVHETVDFSIRAAGGAIASTDIIIHHFHEKKGKRCLREKQLCYLRLCEKNLSKQPNNPKTHFDIGLIHHYVLNDVSAAIPYQKRALELNPDFEDARMELALLYHLSRDLKAEAEHISILLNRNPTHAPAWLRCGIMLEQRGKIDRAIECYVRSIRLNPDLVEARLNLGTLLLKKGNIEGARSEWESVLKLNPANGRALMNLGALALQEGRNTAAEELLGRALEQMPQNGLLWNNLGILYARTSRDTEAHAAFGRAVALAPSSADIRRNLRSILSLARFAGETNSRNI